MIVRVAEDDRNGGCDQREHRGAAKHVEHDDDGEDRREDQRPGPRIDVVDGVDDEHRRKRAELAQDVDRLLSVEWKEAPLAGHGLRGFRLWRVDHAVSGPGNGVGKIARLEGLEIIDTLADADGVDG